MHTLEAHLLNAGQPIGRADACGDGHSQNLSFWTYLQTQNRVVTL